MSHTQYTLTSNPGCYVNILTKGGESLIDLSKIKIATHDENGCVTINGSDKFYASKKLFANLIGHARKNCNMNIAYVSGN